MVGIYPWILDGNEKTVNSTVTELPVICCKLAGRFAQAEKLTSTIFQFTNVPTINVGKELHQP
jgi:hypothetical protein